MTGKPAQDFVAISEIKYGAIVMKDGGMRMVLMASSLNFALKSPEEQESTIYQFQSFLNSLDFSIQIFVQSRKYDIRPYIALLEGRERDQVNDLLKIQTREYINFIRKLTEITNIMTKNFFVVVPYSPFSAVSATKSALSFLGGSKKTKAVKDAASFEEGRSQLEQRAYVVQQGLVRCGIRTKLLGTEELVELFYRIFNPGEQEKPLPPAA